MLFSSFIFISVFLPLVLGGYYLVPHKWRNGVLLVASILFYAWGDFNYLSVMVGVVLLDFIGALVVESIETARPLLRKVVLAIFILANLSVLIYFKYFDFLMVNFSRLADMDYAIRNIVMPLGISFYTFQGLSYLIDVYRREIPPQKNLLTLTLFIMYFPQLVAGPILKYHDVRSEMESRQESFGHFAYGVRRFIMGFSKKMIIANSMGLVVDRIFCEQIGSFGPVVAWGGAVAYSLQLYFDFSGYSDMAIGLGAMFGFHFLENFNYPYTSQSVTEFWRRWHISLSTWFKEYLYIPLGGNRVSKGRNLLNLFVVFLATGIWHGAEWTFVVWGLFHGFFIILEKLTGWNKIDSGVRGAIPHRVYLLFVVVIAWVIFRAENLSYAIGYLGTMFGVVKVLPMYSVAYYFSNWSLIFIGVAVALSSGVFPFIETRLSGKQLARTLMDVWLLVLFFCAMALMAGETYNPFIYFRF